MAQAKEVETQLLFDLYFNVSLIEFADAIGQSWFLNCRISCGCIQEEKSKDYMEKLICYRKWFSCSAYPSKMTCDPSDLSYDPLFGVPIPNLQVSTGPGLITWESVLSLPLLCSAIHTQIVWPCSLLVADDSPMPRRKSGFVLLTLKPSLHL